MATPQKAQEAGHPQTTRSFARISPNLLQPWAVLRIPTCCTRNIAVLDDLMPFYVRVGSRSRVSTLTQTVAEPPEASHGKRLQMPLATEEQEEPLGLRSCLALLMSYVLQPLQWNLTCWDVILSTQHYKRPRFSRLQPYRYVVHWKNISTPLLWAFPQLWVSRPSRGSSKLKNGHVPSLLPRVERAPWRGARRTWQQWLGQQMDSMRTADCVLKRRFHNMVIFEGYL